MNPSSTLVAIRNEFPFLPEFEAQLLAPWTLRLAGLLGPIHYHAQSTDGEPDGYDGITSRGIYQRLLASQWALADAEPLEFLRRAAAGEHLFHTLARSEPTVDKTTWVLFDCGPDQLGAPRLVHLALALALDLRARRGKSKLSWGIVQIPGLHHDGLSIQGLRELVEHGTQVPASVEMLTRWSSYLDEVGCATQDRWVVSSPRLLRQSSQLAYNRLSLEDAAQGEDAVLVELERQSGSPQRCILAMPRPQDCIRLLRNPFRPPDRPAQREHSREFTCAGHLWFDARSSRLLSRTSAGDVVAMHVPDTPTNSVGEPRFYRRTEGELIRSAGRFGKHFVVLVQSQDQWVLRTTRERDHDLVLRVNNEAPTFGDNDEISPLTGAFRYSNGQFEGQFLDGKARLWAIENDPADKSGTSRRLLLRHTNVVLMCKGASDRRIVFEKTGYRLEGSERVVVGLPPRPNAPAPFVAYSHGQRPRHATSAHPINRATWPWGLLALRTGPGTISVWHGAQEPMLLPAPLADSCYLGVVWYKDTIGLLQLDEPGLILRVQTDNGYTLLHRFSERIRHATVSARGDRVAVVTVRDEIWVYSFAREVVVLHRSGVSI